MTEGNTLEVSVRARMGWAESESRVGDLHLTYDTSDPLAVRLRLTTVDGDKLGHTAADRDYLVARDVVRAFFAVGGNPIVGPIGAGAVKFLRMPGGVCLSLDAGNLGKVIVICAGSPLAGFIQSTEGMVPVGSEAYDVDSWLEGLGVA